MMAQVPSSSSLDIKRVKVYELKNGEWLDSGTGLCTALFVLDDATRSEEPRLLVHSESKPDIMLLDTNIFKSESFRMQSGLDTALSFQESEGCAIICIQQQLHNIAHVPGSHALQEDALSDEITSDPYHSPIPPLSPLSPLPHVSLPSPGLGSLHEIESQMRGLHNTEHGREALTKYVLTEEYVQKLVPLVEMAEDMEDLASLHHLCNIMKTLISLNDTTIIELMVTDDIVMGVVGALEYDPYFPSHKANHRQWLSKEGRYKEVVPIDEEIRNKIHSTYRLQYLKDVVLARILDDPTFSVLNSLIFFNQVEIVQHLQTNPVFLNNLFGIFKEEETNQERKKEAVLFIQQCCAVAKNLQPASRQQLYNNFLSCGLLSVIKFALRHSDSGVRIGVTDILVSMIDHDPQMIRQTIFYQMNGKQTPLTNSLIDLLLVEPDLGVKAQVADAIKVLLDPGTMNRPPENLPKPTTEQSARMRQQDMQQAEFVREFYDEPARKLFRPLIDLKDKKNMVFSVQEISLYIYLIEILCFFVRQHTHHSKYFILSEKLGHRIAQLLSCQEKYLKLIGLQDEFYNQQMTQGKLFGPILDLVLETMPRDTLLNSAAFELFTFIGREKINDLNSHLVENYREKMEKITCVNTFSYLINRYDNTQGFTIIVAETQDEVLKNDRPFIGSRWGMGLKDLDAQEEEYFNSSDDEEEALKNELREGPHRSYSSSKPLVDYLSDEENDLNADNESRLRSNGKDDSVVPSRSRGASRRHSIGFSEMPSIAFEKLSEKRRHEADEVDELDKLSQANKRRNSINSTGSNGVRKKMAFSNGSTGHSPKSKIAINISALGKRSVESHEISGVPKNSLGTGKVDLK
ncbi:Serine/threonine-protein phosphatase 4 regulatory subunit [Blumeria hordei DH14]|uniref:Serine/threonine-protein phosphatase 4 regulatory subunit n=1 Tax=Blumeria graminis f. sp. hordei (strain DH14) TaxID=546991 RepID=N1JI79_BLUG1|nr:Serine/threonine-protein phosphatase 4 regulatory subunit [Blumeria hordei DH14]